MNKKIVKISIYNSRCTPSEIMQGNGDAILDNICILADTDENLETGEYYLDATFIIDKEGLWNYIQEESILKVQMDYGEEYFRIAKVQSTSRDITVFARQETIYQTLHMWLTDVRPENQNGLGSLTHIKNNSTGPKNIKVSSDISTISTAYYQDMNMYKALHDCDQSFLNRWGGEIQRRGYNLTINKRIGTHRGVQIRSRKNLTGFEANVDMDNVFTRIKPKGFDGITIDGFVDSPLINNYTFIKTTTITYDDVKVKDPDKEDDEGFNTLKEAQAELVRRANLEFSQKNIDKIQASYRVNFIQLEQTEEYKNYAAAERVFLGDSVDVYEDTLNIDITVRAIRRKYDVLRQRVIEIELSNEVVKKKPPTIGDIVNELDKIADEIKENNNWYKDAVNNATDLIQNGLKDSYVVVRKNEILVMDTTDINTAINVWRFNRGGLGFSSTGYYGTYETAITMDGSIVGKFITGLIVNGHEINAKNLNVYRDSDGVKSLEITSGGDVNLNVNTLQIRSNNVYTVNDANNYINTQISASEGRINLEVSKKSDKNELISLINLSPEQIKIQSDKLELSGYTTFSNLASSGETVINADNIKTGTIEAINLRAIDVRGKSMIYIEDNGILSCDGHAYLKNLFIPETHPGWAEGTIGTFSCAPNAWFDRDIHVTNEIYTKGTGVIRRQNGVFIQVDALGIQEGSPSHYLLVNCYNSQHVFGVDLWYSDEKLKENIVEINNKARNLKNSKLQGLDLINSIIHYSYDYKEELNLGGGVSCGYIAQQLQGLNDELVREINQNDGTVNLEPRASSLIPHITLAMQQQQEQIELLNQQVELLKEEIRIMKEGV